MFAPRPKISPLLPSFLPPPVVLEFNRHRRGGQRALCILYALTHTHATTTAAKDDGGGVAAKKGRRAGKAEFGPRVRRLRRVRRSIILLRPSRSNRTIYYSIAIVPIKVDWTETMGRDSVG